MITENKYPEYKDSEIEWLGEIPSHWNTKRVKDLFEISRGRVISKEIVLDEGEYPVYSSQTKNNGILGYIDSYDFKGNYLTWTTDGVNAGTVFVRKGEFNCTNVCGLLKLKKEKEQFFSLRFLYHILKIIAKENKRDDINGGKLMSNEMGNLEIFYPDSITEQEAIAHFLDDKVGDITVLISTIDKQIKNLKTYREALITNEITGRETLKNNVEHKKTNVSWAKEIPKNWMECKLKNHVDIKHGYSFSEKDLSDNESEKYLIRISNLVNGDVDPYHKPIFIKNSFDMSQFLISKDSILLGLSGSIKASYVKENSDNLYLNQRVAEIKGSKNILNKYLYYFLSAPDVIKSMISEAKINTHANLSNHDVGNITFFMPPLKEQERITEYLDNKISSIDCLIENLKQERQNLIDYKKVLINDVVTGKIKVYNEELN